MSAVRWIRCTNLQFLHFSDPHCVAQAKPEVLPRHIVFFLISVLNMSMSNMCSPLREGLYPVKSHSRSYYGS